MSLNRLAFDNCSYEQVLGESLGPGFYQLTTPPNTCKPCHSTDPRIRLQTTGVSLNKDTHLVDVDSELIGLSRNSSNCNTKQYNPNNPCLETSKLCIDMDKTTIDFDDCFKNTEDTRLSNPPCTLRGTGWNRWEWLCLDPQERVLMPFDHNISNRLVVKDNHRPCIPQPIDVNLSLPPQTGEIVALATRPSASVPTGPPSIQWVDATTMKKL